MIPALILPIVQSKLKLKALNFTGGIKYVAMGNHAAYSFERTDPFSITAWVKFTLPDFMIVASKLEMIGPLDRGYYLQVSGGKVGFFLASDYEESPPGHPSTTNWLFVESSETFHDNVWHNIAVTYDGSSTHAGIKLYCDAVALTRNNSGGPLVGTVVNAAGLQWSGRQAILGRGEFPYTGATNDLAVYNKELSAAELVQVFADHCPPRLEAIGPTANLVGFWRPSLTDVYPTITDLSASGFNGTMTSMAAGDIYSR